MSDDRRMRPEDERERYFALLERELADDGDLEEEESAFLARMESDDRECASFVAALDALNEKEALDSDVIDRAVSEHWKGLHRKRHRSIVACCGFAAAAAAVVAVFVIAQPTPPRDGTERAAGRSRSSFALIERDGTSHGVGGAFDAGENPRLLSDGRDLTIGMDRNSGLEVVEAEESSISLQLKSGRAAFHLRHGASRGLKVMTPICDVTVTGTIFSISVESSEVRVSVVRGSVSVRDRFYGTVALVKAGETLFVREKSKTGLHPNEADGILSLLEMATRSGTAKPLAEEAVATPGSGMSPAEKVAVAPTLAETSGGDQRENRASAGKDEAAPRGAAREEDTRPSDLIRRAREFVRARDWNSAAELYRQIARDFSGASEAITVRVSLADIELDHLHSPNAALVNYQEYLDKSPDGPLAEDAMWGRCAALARLGRSAQEKQSLQEFLKRFPQSIHSRSAQERLIRLETGDKVD